MRFGPSAAPAALPDVFAGDLACRFFQVAGYPAAVTAVPAVAAVSAAVAAEVAVVAVARVAVGIVLLEAVAIGPAGFAMHRAAGDVVAACVASSVAFLDDGVADLPLLPSDEEIVVHAVSSALLLNAHAADQGAEFLVADEADAIAAEIAVLVAVACDAAQ